MVGLLIVHYLREKKAVTYEKYLAVLDDTPFPIANCGVFNEPGKGQDVPDRVLAEDPEVEKYFPVIAEGSSMEDYGIRQEDVAWVKEKKYIDLSAYAVGDRVLIISRSPR